MKHFLKGGRGEEQKERKKKNRHHGNVTSEGAGDRREKKKDQNRKRRRRKNEEDCVASPIRLYTSSAAVTTIHVVGYGALKLTGLYFYIQFKTAA